MTGKEKQKKPNRYALGAFAFGFPFVRFLVVPNVLTHLTIERPGREPEHRDDRYTLRTYSPEEWLDLLSRSALELDQIFDIFGEPIDEARAGYSMFGLRVRADGS